jgi:hypothetical protein
MMWDQVALANAVHDAAEGTDKRHQETLDELKTIREYLRDIADALAPNSRRR